MPRPCLNDHTLSPDSCRICFWCASRTVKGRRLRRVWGEPEPGADPSKPRMSFAQIATLRED